MFSSFKLFKYLIILFLICSQYNSYNNLYILFTLRFPFELITHTVTIVRIRFEVINLGKLWAIDMVLNNSGLHKAGSLNS